MSRYIGRGIWRHCNIGLSFGMVIIGLDHADLTIVINLRHEMGFSNLNVFSAVRLMRSPHGDPMVI